MHVDPQLPYYLLLYLLTVVLRFIRAYRSRPSSTAEEGARREYRARFWFFGFELVNVSAGVFILLSQNATTYVASVMMLYVILVILSFFFEDEAVGLRLRVVGHITVAVVVVAVTLIAFYMVVPAPPATTTTQAAEPPPERAERTARTWRVALPYQDTTLSSHLGTKVIAPRLVWTIEVTATDRHAALEAAVQQFASDSGPAPFRASERKTDSNLITYPMQAVVESRDAFK